MIDNYLQSKFGNIKAKVILISKAFVALSLVLIACIAILMIFKQESAAQTMAVWAYLSLSIAVLVRFVYFVLTNGGDYE